MVSRRQYATAGAFRAALETRLLERSRRDAVDLQRLRRQVAFDRLLARMFDPSLPIRGSWVLKGGYALELRFHKARSTRDLDFTIRGGLQIEHGDRLRGLREHLQSAALVRLPDYFAFIVGEAMTTLDQAPEGGARFPVDARLDGRTFVTFHVDLGLGDEVLDPLEELIGEDWLAFAGIGRSVALALSAEQHWAEKLHAYTLPRTGATNSRVRDLIDLAFLLERRPLSPDRIRRAVRATFDRRGTHPPPARLAAPPPDWERPFMALAEQCGLSETVQGAWRRVDDFYRSFVLPGLQS
jgi:hypothetical protein